MNIDNITQLYDVLSAKVKTDLDEQATKGRIKGTDYATVYSSLMSVILQSAAQADVNIAQENKLKSAKEVDIAHAAMLVRQKEGFNDHTNIELFKTQLNAWGVMFSSGMLEKAPDIIANDEISDLYQSMVSSNK